MRRLAAALDAARRSRSRIGKEEALAEAFAAIANDADGQSAVGTAVRLATGRTLPVGDARAVGVGGALLVEVAVRTTGFADWIVGSCARRSGDLGEAIGLLAARDPRANERPGLTFAELAETFDTLAATGARTTKLETLVALFARATPLEAKYVAKALLGSLRVGAQAGVVEGAIVRAFGQVRAGAGGAADVRRALALVTDPGVVASLAARGALHEACFVPGRPLAYMLATPFETLAVQPDPRLFVVEDKIDGVRTQLHKWGGEIALFARGLERVTMAFPEVVDAFRFVPGNVVLDGEMVVLGPGGRPRPFQALQPRLNRQKPTAAALEEARVTFIAYDYLADDEGIWLDAPWSERRARLEAFARAHGPKECFALNPATPLAVSPVPHGEGGGEATDEAPAIAPRLDPAFDAARARGHEGIVIKRIDSPYETGRRGQAWIKVKRAYATLDVVVTAAEEGHGKRAGTLSDYTFAVWQGAPGAEGDAGSALVNVGKAFSGVTDAEIELLSRKFQRSTLEHFGGVRLVKPEVVFEVAFDGIQRSKRHKSGFALRFPRILRIRDDKRPEEADRLATVEALYVAQLETGHREEPAAPGESVTAGKASAKKAKVRSKKAESSAQLDLFASPTTPEGPPATKP